MTLNDLEQSVLWAGRWSAREVEWLLSFSQFCSLNAVARILSISTADKTCADKASSDQPITMVMNRAGQVTLDSAT